MQQRPIINRDLQEKKDKAAKSLHDYKKSVELNYQEYVSQTSEQQLNDLESISRPSVKSMPVKTRDLLNKYKAQLEIIPKFQLVSKPNPQLLKKYLEPEEHLQSVSSQQSKPPKNPFQDSQRTKQDEQHMSFSRQKEVELLDNQIQENIIQTDQEGQKNPFESSSVMHYTQTQMLDPYAKTVSERNQASHYTSQESSNIQNLSQTQEKSLDSEQFYETIEEQGQFQQSGRVSTGTQLQKLDQKSSRIQNSIKEEIQDESSSMTHSSHQEEKNHVNQSPIYESFDQDSQLVEKAQRWNQYQSIPQNTAEFNPNVQSTTAEVKYEQNNSQQIKQDISNNNISYGQSFDQAQQQSSYLNQQINSKLIDKDSTIDGIIINNRIISKKLSQELVIDMQKFEENSHLLNSINRTQLLFITEKYFDLMILQNNKNLLQDFRLLKKLQYHIFKKDRVILKKCMKQFQVNRDRQLEKYEKDRKSRQFLFSKQKLLQEYVFQAIRQNKIAQQQFLQNVIRLMNNHKQKVLLIRWKTQVYKQKMKRQMDLQYKQFLFNGWLNVVKREKKAKDIKSLTKYYFSTIQKYYQTWKCFTYQQQRLKSKFLNAQRNINLMKKKFIMSQWINFIQEVKREKEFEAYVKQANEYVPVKVSLKPQNIKIYNIK
ncbi:unnamed protein product (macronuclear) [Paramecium tetraurelia]|uniref:Sfi1 spindle body domain-containing protein n=1 Tax=Paramecium tetraurelia TaxID=5888 RepID=A0BMH8_PARTE|nr:uncharacterized protein GSPATT00030381001 [Paramecium tetraurelia]CAK59745.1 unnamed protein product [Paramecium tetraurelia]|eukprot:XP_001427143.1 hypothetical protein (macronuclear) [Paramecium tetraurelia strain d4-2]